MNLLIDLDELKAELSAIEAESIEMEFRQPIFAITQKEMGNIILAVIKTKTIPCRMFTALSWIEILILVTGKIA